MMKLLTLTLATVSMLLAGNPVAPVYQENGIAVKGYDVVAYFTVGEPTKGTPEFVHKWNGATWQFSSAKNRDLFKADPEKYAPQYGGYCSYAVSINRTASISPKAWKIVDGKLYLNHALAQGKWEKHIPDNIEKANTNWPSIPKKPVE